MENYTFLLMGMTFLLLCKAYTLTNKKSAICGLIIGEKVHWKEQTLCRDNENHRKCGLFNFFKEKDREVKNGFISSERVSDLGSVLRDGDGVRARISTMSTSLDLGEKSPHHRKPP